MTSQGRKRDKNQINISVSPGTSAPVNIRSHTHTLSWRTQKQFGTWLVFILSTSWNKPVVEFWRFLPSTSRSTVAVAYVSGQIKLQHWSKTNVASTVPSQETNLSIPPLGPFTRAIPCAITCPQHCQWCQTNSSYLGMSKTAKIEDVGVKKIESIEEMLRFLHPWNGHIWADLWGAADCPDSGTPALWKATADTKTAHEIAFTCNLYATRT
jgi:hypothetical protein